MRWTTASGAYYNSLADFAQPTGIVTTDLDATAATFLAEYMEQMYKDEIEIAMSYMWHGNGWAWELKRSDGEVVGIMMIRHVGTCDNFKPKEATHG